jgi:MFS family permease
VTLPNQPPTRLGLTFDGRLLFAARSARMFGYGALAVILVLYLTRLGLTGETVGAILSLALVGDILVSLWLTTHADRLGRRRVLIVGSLLMVGAGVGFALTDLVPVLLIAATVGVISPSGNEVGPFLAIEQSSLSEVTADRRRTSVFAWYNLAGSIATACGALAAGLAVSGLRAAGVQDIVAYRVVVLGYAAIGMSLAILFSRVTAEVEAPHSERLETSIVTRLGLHRSRGTVLRLASLFAVDAFAGGLVMQSILAYWFHVTYGLPEALLGGIFFAANLLAAGSALAAARIAERIGLVNTMVFTHLPSNVLLILVPLMPNAALAILVLLARFSISQMDVPTRQSYTMAVVDPDERSAAAGVTGIARSTGAAISANFGATLVAMPALAAMPFFVGGALKIAYDVALWGLFRARPAPEELREAS